MRFQNSYRFLVILIVSNAKSRQERGAAHGRVAGIFISNKGGNPGFVEKGFVVANLADVLTGEDLSHDSDFYR